MWATQVRSLGWEDPLGKGMATHSSILAWRIPWTEEPGALWPVVQQQLSGEFGFPTAETVPGCELPDGHLRKCEYTAHAPGAPRNKVPFLLLAQEPGALSELGCCPSLLLQTSWPPNDMRWRRGGVASSDCWFQECISRCCTESLFEGSFSGFPCAD